MVCPTLGIGEIGNTNYEKGQSMTAVAAGAATMTTGTAGATAMTAGTAGAAAMTTGAAVASVIAGGGAVGDGTLPTFVSGLSAVGAFSALTAAVILGGLGSRLLICLLVGPFLTGLVRAINGFLVDSDGVCKGLPAHLLCTSLI